MLEPHIPAFEFAQQLRVMIAWDTERGASHDHVHDQAEHFNSFRATINQITQEDSFTSLGNLNSECTPILLVESKLIAKLREQLLQFIKAAMHITDNIEWAMLMLEVIPQGL